MDLTFKNWKSAATKTSLILKGIEMGNRKNNHVPPIIEIEESVAHIGHLKLHTQARLLPTRSLTSTVMCSGLGR